MPRVFLSYDHDDATRAAPIATALESAGHSVWWDRRIHGGAEFNNEIEAALEAADAIVVLWSESSVRSAWVRDEAAEGRDRGKLVPLLLDPVKPPMGFRQYQTIDLVGWKPRQRIPRLDELLLAIGKADAQAGGEDEPKLVAVASHASATPAPTGMPNRWWRWAAGIGAALILIAGAVAWTSIGGSSRTVVAVAPADTSAMSYSYARDLLGKLGRLQAAGLNEIELADASSRSRADFTFEIGVSDQGGTAHANLVLKGGAATILWSSDFERAASAAADLRQQIGYTATEVLDCAVEAHAAGLSDTDDVLRSYLTGCAELAVGNPEHAPELVQRFRQVVADTPRFAAGWSKLLLAEVELAKTGTPPPGLRNDIAEARKLDEHMPAAYLAELALLPADAYAQSVALVERALARHPDDPHLLAARADVMDGVGRNNDSISDLRKSVDREPTSPLLRVRLIHALANGGRLDAAFKELDEADRLWPGWSELYSTRYMVNAIYGDPDVARRMGEAQAFFPSWTRARHFWEARLSPTPANIERNVAEMREAAAATPDLALRQFIVVLGTFHREPELRELMMSLPQADATFYRAQLFRPNTLGFWKDPASLAYAKRIGLLQFWRASGKWPDFCFEPGLPYDCEAEAAKRLG